MMSECSSSEFSPADGFLEIGNNLAEMIKFVANEPCVGLFYIQQHTHNAVPNLNNLKTKVVERSHETSLHTQDLEDSIVLTRSMKDCGFPIVEAMIKDIRHSLAALSTRQEKKGLLNIVRSSSFRLGRTSSWGLQHDVGRNSPLLNKFRLGGEKPNSIKRPQLESKELEQPVKDSSSSLAVADEDSDDLPVSSPMTDYDEPQADRRLSRDHLVRSMSKSYEDLTSEARLEVWLERTGNGNAA